MRTTGSRNMYIPAKIRITAVCIACILSAGAGASADKSSRINRKGVEAWENQAFDESAEHFMDAVVEKPDSPELRFNLGTALSVTKDTEEALRQLDIASRNLESPEMKAAAHFNAANTSMLAGDLERAIREYREALTFDQSSSDIRNNLEIALRKWNDQQKQQKEQEQKEEGEQEEQNEEEKQDRQKGKNEEEEEQKEEEQDDEEKDSQTKNTDDREQEDQQQQPSSQEQSESQPMTPEEAKRILDALSDEEKKALSLRRMQMQTETRQGDDW